MPFNHFDDGGRAVMVDVGEKEPTRRTAAARATVFMKKETAAAITAGGMKKGDVLGIARIAGIAAAKKTCDLIPLAHPIALTSASVDFEVDGERGTVVVTSTVKAFDRTGVEMEAMVSASVAALTIYDMCKAIDRGMEVSGVRLLEKSGGRSGTWRREAQGGVAGAADADGGAAEGGA
jgi:cyclic pyranopterin phosphate synthase